EGQAVTNYHFEWGTSESYGSSTPPGTLPAGGLPVAVETQLSGLSSGQTYHYRLLATNAAGTSTGPDQTFTAITSPQLPQRGNEVVSQLPTGGIPIVPGTSEPNTSDDGNRVMFKSAQPLPGSNAHLPDDQLSHSDPMYESLRGPSGWSVAQAAFGTG